MERFNYFLSGVTFIKYFAAMGGMFIATCKVEADTTAFSHYYAPVNVIPYTFHKIAECLPNGNKTL